jgi:16S rRNA G966 N2-methylase RsmD
VNTWELRLLDEMPWTEWLTPGGVFALEWGLVKSKFETLPEETRFFQKTREKLYGDSGLTFYEKK